MAVKQWMAVMSTALLGACGGGGSSDGNSNSSNLAPDSVLVSGGVTANIVSINGITVPPDPGAAGKASVAGVDANNNGIRDEVDRELARLYGRSNTSLTASSRYAKSMQSSMLALNAAASLNVDAIIKSELASFTCLANDVGQAAALGIAREVAMRTFNSSARRDGLDRLESSIIGMDLSSFGEVSCE